MGHLRRVVAGKRVFTRCKDTDLWETPDSILELVRQLGPIKCDPATHAGNPTGAEIYYTPAEDGLLQPWHSLTYFNHPYSFNRLWLAKAEYEAYDNGVEIVGLVPANVGTRWFSHCFRADGICFVEGRLWFKGATGPAPFDSAIPYWGERVGEFRRIFRHIGHVLVK